MPIPVVTVAQMQALEEASARAGVSRDDLMENAGLACALHIRQQLGGIAGRRILALIGPGSNGADGLVIARRLAQWGADAHCYILRPRPDADPKMDAARRAGVTIDDAAADPDHSRLTDRLARCDAVIDAILGAGRYRPPQGVIADAINLVNRRRRGRHQNQHQLPPVFAIDLPTGVHPNTAAVADPTIVADATLALHQNHRPPVFAIDLPTGIHPDTAAVADPTIIADATLALACPKPGIAHFPGAGCAGRITVLDIGIPPAVVDAARLPIHWMDAALASTLLPPRPPDAHKGTFGHLLIIAGSRHYIGAAALAAMAAHRAGAGLVTLATPASIYPIAAARLTETIHLPLPESADGGIAPAAARIIRERLASDRRGAYNALAVGCGMGQSLAAADFLRQLLQDITDASASNAAPGNANTGNTDAGNASISNAAPGNASAGNASARNSDARNSDARNSDAHASTLPLVIDADGLNNLARCADWPALLRGVPAVLTPHPGEMATLTGRAVPDIQSQRPTVAARYAAEWGQTILLKGAHTIIATPATTPSAANLATTPNAAGFAVTPSAANLATTPNAAGFAVTPSAANLATTPNAAGPDTDVSQRILPFANPALAAGGAGDVLTGIIGALLAQGLSPYDAAALGGYLHAIAGEYARRMQGAAGVIASDLPPLLPSIIQTLRMPD